MLTSHMSGMGVWRDRNRVSVFIDGAHLFYTASILGIEIDYSKLIPLLVNQDRLLRAYFYSGVDPNNANQQGFLHWMKRNGYRVITREISKDAHGESRRAVDFSVDITIDLMQQAAFCDRLILLTGDGRFARALNHFAYLGTRVELVSLKSITSDRLLNEADGYADIATLKDSIAKQVKASPRSRSLKAAKAA